MNSKRRAVRRHPQAWVRAHLWNPHTRQRGLFVNVLLDSGAGGGNYASASFVRGIERSEYKGKNMISRRGKGRLLAANPINSKVPPMDILGTCLLALVFPPIDGIFRAKVRVVKGLPYGLVLGTEFMSRHESLLSFGRPGLGWFKPTPDSDRVPLLSSIVERPNIARPSTREEMYGATTRFQASHWTPSEDQDQSTLPSEVAAMDALDLGATAWEDDGTLQWRVFLTDTTDIPGGVSVEIDARVEGPLPNAKTLMLVFPVSPFDLEGDGKLGIAKGVQWWSPGSAPKVKITNRSSARDTINGKVQVARAFAVNCHDVERMLLIKQPIVENERTPSPVRGPNPDQDRSQDDRGVKVSEAKVGQLGPEARKRLMTLLEKFNVKKLFPGDAKVVEIKHGRKVALPLKDENVTPIACKAQRWNPHMSDILMKQINPMIERKIFRFSTSSWCSRIVPVPKSDGSYRICVDYRPLNNLIKKDSGGLGDINGILDRMKASNFFTSLDLAQAYHQLELKEEDKHNTAFRDPTGRLLESNVCTFGISTIPAVFSATLGDDLRVVLGKGVEKWLDDILLHTKTLEEHFALLAQVLELLCATGYVINSFKSVFILPELEFLGMMVGHGGTWPAPSKVKALQDMAMPTTVG